MAEGIRLSAEETTAFEVPPDALNGPGYWVLEQVSYVQATVLELPLWLRILLLAIIVVSLVQWRSRRR